MFASLNVSMGAARAHSIKRLRRAMRSTSVRTRPQSSERLDRHGEHVADPARRLDDARRARVLLELAAQSEDLDVDAAIEDVLVDAGGLQEMLARQRPSGR